MTCTRSEARDEMFTRIREVVELNGEAVFGFIPEMRWQFVKEPATPETPSWLRSTLQHIDSDQTTLSTNVGKPGQKRYTSYGLMYVQFLLSKADDESAMNGDALAVLIQKEFRDKQSQNAIVYRNIRILELPSENQYHRLNVVAEFEYDEVNKE